MTQRAARASSRPAVSEEGAATLSGAVYARLRQDILDGALPPGGKLRIEAVSERYGVTSTPVREALNRLAMEGFVHRQEQRGFFVAGASEEELTELTNTRCWVEPIALREAIAHRTVAWEEGLVLAFHRLARTPRSTEETSFRENPAWEEAHRAFHAALIATCPSRWLREFCARLSDHAARYRRLAMQAAYRQRDVAGEHRAILDAAVDGRTAETEALLVGHYQRTASFVLGQAAGAAMPSTALAGAGEGGRRPSAARRKPGDAAPP